MAIHNENLAVFSTAKPTTGYESALRTSRGHRRSDKIYMESKTPPPIWRNAPPHPWHPPPTEHLVNQKAEDDIGPKQQGLRRTRAKKLASWDPSDEHGSRGMQTKIAANLIMSDAERDSQSSFASIRSTDGIGVSERRIDGGVLQQKRGSTSIFRPPNRARGTAPGRREEADETEM